MVTRLHMERPNATTADIAAKVGVSERHVRRILAAQTCWLVRRS
jgi:hypothetical protein